MMQETMTCFELSAFEGTSLMHLHKNMKNSVKLPIKEPIWPMLATIQPARLTPWVVQCHTYINIPMYMCKSL